MTQTINLYDASLRPSRDFLALNNVAIGVVLALVVLMLLAVFGMVRSDNELRTFRTAEAKLRQAQEQLVVFAAQQAGRKQDVGLENELAESKQQLSTKAEILSRLQSGEFGQRAGFSPYFRGLASVEVDGVWITGFEATAGGQLMEIRGRMLNESNLPRYVQALSRQTAFAGREFSALNVNRVEAKAGEANALGVPAYVEFALSGIPVAGEASKGAGR